MGKVVKNRSDYRGDGGGGGGRVAKLAVDDLEVLHHLLLVGENLDVPLSCYHFLNIAVDLCGALLLGAVAAAAYLGGLFDNYHHYRREDDHYHKEPH